ncbi:MAG: YabP/YqfC family sporulation protein [Oscillospiraceae bacterium]|nr:YabP/YqfC family sporulation protein [Oscillospiraceae bacterium]
MRKRIQRTVMNWMYLDTYVHMHGNRELRVENVRRILAYDEICVRLRTRDMTVTVWGTGLRVYDYKSSSMLVTGRITSVELSETR